MSPVSMAALVHAHTSTVTTFQLSQGWGKVITQAHKTARINFKYDKNGFCHSVFDCLYCLPQILDYGELLI